MMKSVVKPQVSRIMALAVVLILIFNTMMLARSLDVLRFPGEVNEKEVVRDSALQVIQYIHQQAVSGGVANHEAVKEVLGKFRYEVDNASTKEEIIQVMLNYSRDVQEIITREIENRRRELVLKYINQDPNLLQHEGETKITIRKSEDKGVEIDDPKGLLTAATKEKIRSDPMMRNNWQIIEVEIKDSKASIALVRTLSERLEILEKEHDSLKARLSEVETNSGYSKMNGSGIIVRLYDAEGSYDNSSIVHDGQLRDITNELFAAGAKGIAIGGQRMIATTSIRCAGPVILVNQTPISVDPVTIDAIGDPDVLESSLELLKNYYENVDGIRVEIEKSGEIELPPYRGN